jgi:hypothetical protein
VTEIPFLDVEVTVKKVRSPKWKACFEENVLQKSGLLFNKHIFGVNASHLEKT